MISNTGNKVAAQILLTKKVNGIPSQKYYSLGRFVDEDFYPYSGSEIAKLTPFEYMQCLEDTKEFITTQEGLDNVDDLFVNEAIYEDHDMCPINSMLVNKLNYAFSDVIDDIGAHLLKITVSFNYPVASDVVVNVKFKGANENHTFKIGDQSFEKTVDYPITAYTLESELISVGGTPDVTSDNQYDYKTTSVLVEPYNGKRENYLNLSVSKSSDNTNVLSGNWTYPPSSRVSFKIKQPDGTDYYGTSVTGSRYGFSHEILGSIINNTVSGDITAVGEVQGVTSDDSFNYSIPSIDINQ